MIGYLGFIVDEGVSESLLGAVILVDGEVYLDELVKLVVEVDHLVGGEEVVGICLELTSGLIAGEDHVGDILVDGGMDDGVDLRAPCGIGGGSQSGVVDVAEVAGAT
jgi:hypothetical protein